MSLKVVEINTVLTYEIMTSSCLKKNGVKKMALDVSNNIIRCGNNFILN